MPVVTIHGPVGSRADELGVKVAHSLNAGYVDRLILAQAAKLIGSTVRVLEIKEKQKVPLRDRIAYFLQSMLERSAMSGAAGEPYFSHGIEYLPAEEYGDLAQEPLTAAQRLNDQRFIEVTSGVIRDLADAGNVVIIGRGSNVILKDKPGTLHVGLESPEEIRVRNVEHREHLARKDAEKFVFEGEKAREMYFKKFFKVHPQDVTLYNVMLNMRALTIDTAAEIVSNAAQKLESQSTAELNVSVK